MHGRVLCFCPQILSIPLSISDTSAVPPIEGLGFRSSCNFLSNFRSFLALQTDSCHCTPANGDHILHFLAKMFPNFWTFHSMRASDTFAMISCSGFPIPQFFYTTSLHPGSLARRLGIETGRGGEPWAFPLRYKNWGVIWVHFREVSYLSIIKRVRQCELHKALSRLAALNVEGDAPLVQV